MVFYRSSKAGVTAGKKAENKTPYLFGRKGVVMKSLT
jgi:hypothetical protein